jgi:hypothetical protein
VNIFLELEPHNSFENENQGHNHLIPKTLKKELKRQFAYLNKEDKLRAFKRASNANVIPRK